MFKNVFPLAVHIGGYNRLGGKVKISQHHPADVCCGGTHLCERQGNSFTKPFKPTLVVVFLTCNLYLLPHVQRFGNAQNVEISP